MAFYTPRGLKIRLDREALEAMVDGSDVPIDLGEAYLDLELWSCLPRAMGVVAGLVAALSTHSVTWIVISAVLAFSVGSIVQWFRYSPLLRLIFPQLLGSWLIAVPVTLLISAYFFWIGHWAAATTILIIAVAAYTGIADLLLFVWFPLRVLLRRTGIVPPIGDMELALISILDLQATANGGELNWAVFEEKWKSGLAEVAKEFSLRQPE